MKKIKLLFIVGLFSANFVGAQAWRATTTAIGFTAKMLGVRVDGKFKGFQGNIIFDANNLNNATISGSVDAATIDTDNNLRNTHVKEKKEFFEVVKFPKLKMESTKIEKSGSAYIGTFNFTVKTITKTLKIPFTVDISGDKAVFKGNAKINRKDWGIGGNTLGMSNDVTLNILINTTKI